MKPRMKEFGLNRDMESPCIMFNYAGNNGNVTGNEQDSVWHDVSPMLLKKPQKVGSKV